MMSDSNQTIDSAANSTSIATGRAQFRRLILNEPYRLFFPLGWLSCLVGVTYWILIGTRVLSDYAPLYHGLIQIELFGGAFAIGFLMTALPKFLRTSGPTGVELSLIVSAYLALAGSLLSNNIAASQICFVVLITFVVLFALRRVSRRKASPPYSFLLVGFGLLQGLLGAILILVPLTAFPLLGQKFIEQGMLLSLSLGVGSFLGPRLMGVVDLSNAIVSLPGHAQSQYPWYKNPHGAVFLIGLFLLVSFPLETGLDRTSGLLLRALAALFCLARFGVLTPPKSQSVVGHCVAAGLWLMVLGLWLAVLLRSHEVGAMHITYIGGFGLLILAIGAQVTTSHGGIANFWKLNRTWCKIVLGLVLAAALIRAQAAIFPDYYLNSLALAAGLLDIALLLWGFGVLRYIGAHSARR